MLEKITLPRRIIDSFDKEKIDVYYYKTVDSTNKRARFLATEHSLARPTLIIADGQSEGRGRMGKSFYSPSSTGLYMTLVLPVEEGELFTRLTALCAVAVRKAIIDIFGVKTKIKWVNDLYLSDKKVAGILAECFEADSRRYVALGVGVNVFTSDFPTEIEEIAGSLTAQKEEDADEQGAIRIALAFSICRELMSIMRSDDLTQYMQIYREASCVINKDIIFFENREEKRGRAVDINERGELIVHTAQGIRILCGGEISVRLRKE